MNTSTNTQNPSESTFESTNENLGRDKKTSKPAKSNSELMAEFFSINSDADKK